MWLRVNGAQHVTIADVGLTVDFADGEEMLTEVSCKFTRAGVAAELAAAGLTRTHWWTDPAGDFGLSLANGRYLRPGEVFDPEAEGLDADVVHRLRDRGVVEIVADKPRGKGE